MVLKNGLRVVDGQYNDLRTRAPTRKRRSSPFDSRSRGVTVNTVCQLRSRPVEVGLGGVALGWKADARENSAGTWRLRRRRSPATRAACSRHLHGVVPELDEDGLDVDGTLSVVKGEEIEQTDHVTALLCRVTHGK